MDQAQLYSLYETDPSPVVAFLRFLASSYALGPDSSGSHGPGSSGARMAVLDVGCGPGRLLVPIAGLGWTVTGLEPDPEYAAAARRAAQGIEGVRVRDGGFAEIDEENRYDLIAAVNGPFSYVPGASARCDAVARAARALRPGGVLFLHFSNFWWILRHYREPPEQTKTIDGVTVLRTAEHRIDYHAGTFTHVDTFRWREVDGSQHQRQKTHVMYMLGPPETERLLDEAGFIDVRTFNAYQDREARRLTGKRVLIAARRPPA
jgi:SAM-dependent methyltransferase